MARLEVLSGDKAGSVFEIEGDLVKVGQSRRATLRLKDRDVAFMHAAIRRAGDTFELVEEIAAVRGTFVNGERLARGEVRPLAHGDRIAFGKVEVRFLADAAAPAAPAAEPAPAAPGGLPDDVEALRALVTELSGRIRDLQDTVARLKARDLEAAIRRLEVELEQAQDERDGLARQLSDMEARPAERGG